MNIRKERRFTVKMAGFESTTFGAEVSVSHRDLGISDEALAGLNDDEHADMVAGLFHLAETTLVELVHAEILEAANLTQERKSFIHDYTVSAVHATEPRATSQQANKPPANVRKVRTNGRS